MRILKYLFLILLLASIGLFVYIFTQKGDYQVSRSQIIKASKTTVFDYVNDYKNWETFNIMSQNDASMTFDYKAKTSGNGASFSWQGDAGDGTMKTIFVKENDSIAQKMTLGGTTAIVNWKLKDTVGGTKVTYSTKGKIDFKMKVKSFFSGGIKRKMTNEFDRTLFNLNKTLAFELKTYSIKVNGVAQRNAAYFIKQTFSCKTKSLTRNIKIIMPKLVYFFKKNNIPMAGKPFVIYETTMLNTDVVTVSVCIPTQQLVSLMEGSDVTSGQLEAFTCIKTTLKGDYSHREALWKKGQQYILDKKYNPNFAGKYIEIYTKTIDDVKNPSKWETELYLPVFPKAEDILAKPSTGIETNINEEVSQPQPTTTIPKPQIVTPTTIIKPQVVTPTTTTVTQGTKPIPVTPKTTTTIQGTKPIPETPNKVTLKKTDTARSKTITPAKPKPTTTEGENQ